MNHPRLIVSKQMEEFICIQRVEIDSPKCETFIVVLGITWLFAYCKGGNLNTHIWVWFGYFIC